MQCVLQKDNQLSVDLKVLPHRFSPSIQKSTPHVDQMGDLLITSFMTLYINKERLVSTQHRLTKND